jgi:hypothetical protein
MIRQYFLRLTLMAVVAVLVGGCAGANPTIDTTEMTFDGLYPVKGGSADMAWARPGADISQYSKIMLQGVGIEYRLIDCRVVRSFHDDNWSSAAAQPANASSAMAATDFLTDGMTQLSNRDPISSSSPAGL